MFDIRKQWQAISPNAKWDAIKWTGAVIITVGYALLQKVRHLSLDWIALSCLFVLSVAVFLYLGRNKKAPVQANEQAPQQKSDEEIQNLAVYAAALNREVGRLHEKLKEHEAQKAELLLPDRVGQIAQELRQFLREQGPVPKIGSHDSQTIHESIKKAWKINSERVLRIHDGYMARFHDKVEKIIFDLGAIDIRDWDLNNLVNKATHGDDDIESIADRLLALGSQLAIQEYASHFQVQSTSAVRPKVVPADFGPEVPNSALFGLWIVNDGEPAYDITIPEFPFGRSKIYVKTAIPRLGSGERKFCEMWIAKSKNFSVGIGSLYEEMGKLEVDEIGFEIHYKDNSTPPRWYTTKSKLERDLAARGGIAARLIELK